MIVIVRKKGVLYCFDKKKSKRAIDRKKHKKLLYAMNYWKLKELEAKRDLKEKFDELLINEI